MCSRTRSSSLAASTSSWSDKGSKTASRRSRAGTWRFTVRLQGALLTARRGGGRRTVPSRVQRGVAAATLRAAALFVLMSIGLGQVDLNQTVKHVYRA